MILIREHLKYLLRASAQKMIQKTLFYVKFNK